MKTTGTVFSSLLAISLAVIQLFFRKRALAGFLLSGC